MALITFPDIIKPTNLTFGITSSSQAFVSEFTGSSQHVKLPTARWYGSATWQNLSGDDFEDLKVFLAQLEGSFNTFEFGDVSRDTPQSGLPSTIVLQASSSYQNFTTQINVERSSTESTTSITGTVSAFKKGDYFEITSTSGKELKIVTADVNIQNTGSSSVPFVPAMRGTISAGTNLTHIAPRAIVRLTDNEQNSWEIAPPIIGNFGFSFLESF
jgi:hypothetical protein